jgi:hypothetical protein
MGQLQLQKISLSAITDSVFPQSKIYMKLPTIKKNWDIQDFYNLDYVLTTHKDQQLLDQYQQSGHQKDSMTLYNCHQPRYMPPAVFDVIQPHFNFLSHTGLAVNLFRPGQYLPLHVDRFGRYIDVFGADLEKIVRYMVMLEDSAPGQILQINNQCYSTWSAGDCFGWRSQESHAFYNFSMQDRYAIQVTGVLA